MENFFEDECEADRVMQEIDQAAQDGPNVEEEKTFTDGGQSHFDF